MKTATTAKIAPEARAPLGVVFHALHKSASMFLFQLVHRLAREKRIPLYSPNYVQPNDHLLTPDVNHDFCLGPQRDFKPWPTDFDSPLRIRRIYQLRDPRDILVSQYYSFGWSHSDKEFYEIEFEKREQIRNVSVDEYLLDKTGDVTRLEKQLRSFKKCPPRETDCVVRYEQMVTDFRGWLSAVVKPFEFGRFGFKSEGMIIAKYAFRYRNEFRPGNNPGAHKRSVKPGDHVRQLKPETIRQVNRRLAPYLTRLGYLDSAEQSNTAQAQTA